MRDGLWVHDARCPGTAKLWKALGHRAEDWQSAVYQCCPYHCEGVEIGDAITHAWQCPYWDDTGRTPFDDPNFDPVPPPGRPVLCGPLSGDGDLWDDWTQDELPF